MRSPLQELTHKAKKLFVFFPEVIIILNQNWTQS